MFLLNAGVPNVYILESKPFTFRCPLCMLLSLNALHASLWDGIKGRLSSNKDDFVSLLLPKKPLNCRGKQAGGNLIKTT